MRTHLYIMNDLKVQCNGVAFNVLPINGKKRLWSKESCICVIKNGHQIWKSFIFVFCVCVIVIVVHLNYVTDALCFLQTPNTIFIRDLLTPYINFTQKVISYHSMYSDGLEKKSINKTILKWFVAWLNSIAKFFPIISKEFPPAMLIVFLFWYWKRYLLRRLIFKHCLCASHSRLDQTLHKNILHLLCALWLFSESNCMLFVHVALFRFFFLVWVCSFSVHSSVIRARFFFILLSVSRSFHLIYWCCPCYCCCCCYCHFHSDRLNMVFITTKCG